MIEGSHTLRNERRDFVEWHRGRSPYVLWALDVDTDAVRQRLAAAASHLDGLLLDGYRRQPHVTLALCGFAGHRKLLDDEFGEAHLAAQIDALQQLSPQSFEIEIGGLGSFSSAPYLALADDARRIAAIRKCLGAKASSRLDGDYVPHVTVGLYAEAWPAGEVNARLATFSSGTPTCLRIESVSLMSYEPSEIAGPLSRIACFHLARREMEWHDARYCAR